MSVAKPQRSGRVAKDGGLPPDLVAGTLDAMRPMSGAIAVLFGCFLVFNIFDLPARILLPIVIHDAVMVLLAGSLWLGSRRVSLPDRLVHPLAATLALLVASNVLLESALTQEPFNTFYVGIILIGAGAVILSRAWVLLTMLLMVGAWATITAVFTEPKEFAYYSFVIVVASVVALGINGTRVRNQTRLARLRHQDADHREKLARALEMAERAREIAEQAREELDQRVEAGTAALVEAHEDLRRELEQRRRAEAEHRSLTEQLQQAQRLESVGRLAGGVAHDFNNLLTVIRGGIEFVEAVGADHPEAKESLLDAKEAADRAAGVTRQLLAFSRQQVIEPRPIDLRKLVDGLQRMLQRLTCENVSLQTDTSGPPVVVFADPAQVEQVLMNLAINACDAMPEGGQLTIRLEQESVASSSTSAHVELAPGEYAVLSVADTGPGIDDADLDLIFEPFFTTKEVGKGTGLGLSMVHGIVTQHGGGIEVQSRLGLGATFRILLPIHDEETVSRKPVRDGNGSWPKGGEVVLVAEDEQPVRRLAVKVLSNLGYHVLEASNGAEALALAERHANPVDLLVTDVVMPEMDGPELAAELRKRQPALKVLFTSGYNDERVAGRGLETLGNRFLPKPYSIAELASRTRDILDGKDRVRSHQGIGTW